MSTFLAIMQYFVVVVLAIFEIADTGKYFSEKKWGWFGLSAYLAIYWMAWIIHHSFS